MVVLGPAGGGTRQGDYGWTGRVAIALLSACPLALAALTPLEIRVIAAGLSGRRLLRVRPDAYLLYMLIALVAVIAVVTALAEAGDSKARGAPRVFTYDANVPVLR
jgi:hypothetical protein